MPDPANGPATLLEVFRAFPQTSRPLIEYHEALLRGPSPLSVAERELIAAFVSGINACGYCHGIHARTAQNFGVDPDVLQSLLSDIDSASVDPKLRPILRYVEKLTRFPSRITASDRRAVLEAGWSERALHDAVSVCALFNFMNRLVEGLGVSASEEYAEISAKRLHEGGYRALLDLLGP